MNLFQPFKGFLIDFQVPQHIPNNWDMFLTILGY